MEDPDYVPDLGDGDSHRHAHKRRRRGKSPEPEVPDFDWKSHYEQMKDKPIDPPVGIARPPLRIAAFNIQIFGEKKMRKTDISGILVKILKRYDLILVQEIRDSSDTALDKLVKLISSVDPDDPYASIVSERLGRTSSKEQYAFLFRTSRIAVADTYQYDDGEDNGRDLFQREPFAVRFYSPYTAVTDFGIIAIHTEPEKAAQEIDALVKVYDVTNKKWNLPDILIAGDFNADEGYINRDDWSKIALRNDRRFKWMIDDETDTTVGNTDRAYDRFVVAGKKLSRGVVPGSSQVFRFDEAFGLTPEEAEDVSDHYPIEMQLLGTVNHELQSQLSTNVSITVRQKQLVEADKLVRKIYRTPADTEDSAFFSHQLQYDDNSMDSVMATRRDVQDVVQALRQFQKCFPEVLFDGTVEMVKSYMASTLMHQKPMVYGLVSGDGQLVDGKEEGGRDGGGGHCYDVTVTAKIQDPLECSVTVSRHMS